MQIVLCDIREDVVSAWKSCFRDTGVEIACGSILDAGCDLVVSPGNSFGFMDGGIDLVFSEYFGWDVEKKLQNKIIEEHNGELLVGSSCFVHTEDTKIPFLISAPTMRVPMILKDTVNIYLATKAAFILANNFLINRIAIPGMGTGVGRVLPEICARQMKSAFDAVFSPIEYFPKTWKEAQENHQRLYTEKLFDLQYSLPSENN